VSTTKYEGNLQSFHGLENAIHYRQPNLSVSLCNLYDQRQAVTPSIWYTVSIFIKFAKKIICTEDGQEKVDLNKLMYASSTHQNLDRSSFKRLWLRPLDFALHCLLQHAAALFSCSTQCAVHPVSCTILHNHDRAPIITLTWHHKQVFNLTCN